MGKSDIEKKIMLMRPFLPPREELEPYFDRIWKSRQLTNCGPIHTEFENALCNYLGVEHICLFTNGTLALLVALKALNLQGEVITTPFTSVATVQAIRWNNLKPVFVDIDAADLNIDCGQIEAAITARTCAILPVHIFGNPCNVYKIRDVADRNHLKTVYDAAHCFGVKLDGIPLCDFGDLAVLSFHATKVFNCFEGGAIVCHDKAAKEYIDDLKNSIQHNNEAYLNSGLNAKMNEFQASVGLVQLNHIDEVIKLRKKAISQYLELLSEVKGIELIPGKKGVVYNYTYFPVMVNPGDFGLHRDELASRLEKKGIITRKYFHPLVSDLPEYRPYKIADLPLAQTIADRVLCLPLYHDIGIDEIRYVADSLKEIKQTGRTGYL